MRVKQGIAVLLTLALFWALGVGLFSSERALAQAEPVGVLQTEVPLIDPRDTLSVSASVSPSGMAVPVEAQVYLTLVNGATEPISDIEVCRANGELIREIGTLSGSGQSSYVFDETLTPTYKQLKAGGVSYLVRYTLGKGEPGEDKRELSVLAPITRLKVEPGLDFTRSLSANYAQPGDEVCITYRLRNTGNVALTDLVIKDALCGEVARLDLLGPGKRDTFTKNVTIQKTSESKPTVSYTYANAGGRRSEKLDALTIYQADELLEARLDVDKSAVSPGEVVTLQLKLTNRGNVTYDKLEISDQVLGPLDTVPLELKSGDDYVYTKRVNLKTTTTFLFSINGKSAGGSPVSSSSNMLTVVVTPVVDSIKLSVEATPDNSTLSGPGLVNFHIRIHNAGEMDIRNVVLSERTGGEIKNLAVIPPGDTSVEQQYYVSEDTDFVFMVKLSDAEGGELTVMSRPPITVKIQPDGAAAAILESSRTPGATKILGISDTAYRVDQQSSTFNRMVWGVGAVLLLLLIVFMVGAFTRVAHRRKQRRLQLKRLRRGRRNARLDDIAERDGDDPHGNTGVYRKTDLMPRKGVV